MKKHNSREDRALAILGCMFILLAIGSIGAGYLSYRYAVMFLGGLILVVCAGFALVWRRRALRDGRQQQLAATESLSASESSFHTQALVYAQRDLARVISAVTSSQAAWPRCLEIALQVSGMDSGGIYVFDAGQRSLELVHHHGLGAAFVQIVSRYPVDAPNAQALLAGTPLYFTSAELDQQGSSREEGVRSLAAIPIHHQGRVLGGINVASHVLSQVPEFSRHALETIAAEIGNIIAYLRTEDSLRLSTQILRKSQSMAHLASWTADIPAGTFQATSEGSHLLRWITGTHTASQLVAMAHPDDQDYVRSAWAAAMHSALYDVEYRIIVDDVVRWVHIKARITYDAQRDPISALGILQDITERRWAEETLKAEQLRFAKVSATIPGVICTFLLRPDGSLCIPYASQAFEDVYGLTLADVAEGISPLIERVPPEQAAELVVAVRESARTLQPWRNEYLYRHPLKGDIWLEGYSIPIREADGSTVWHGFTTDITEHKRIERDLLELNRTLEERVNQRTVEVQDLYENAPNGYHSLDASGNVSMVNQTELTWLGYSRDEMIGRPFSDFITAQSRIIFQENYGLFKQRGWVRGLEYELIRKDGTTFHVLLDATAIYDQHGTYLSSRSTMVDNTERKRAEETLRHANTELARAGRAKDEFLANMSHELRTPLNAILSLSEALQEDVYGVLNVRQLDSLCNIEASGRHLLTLINDILDLSKVEAGRLDINVDTVSVADICQASLVFVKEQALKKSIQLAFQMNDQLAEVQVDPKRMKQMLVNLLSNAVKFTPAKGQVNLDVTTDAEAGAIHFAVQDTGIGIAPDDLPELFQPFRQLDSSLSRQHEGTGLGLALVRRLAELHGGRVTVESVSGQGSCFTITLPYHAPQAQETKHHAASLPVSITGAGALRSALVIEDSASAAEQLTRYMQGMGIHDVVHVQGGDALDRAISLQPDLIFLDLQMPDRSGWEILAQLKAAAQTRDIPVLIVSVIDERARGLAAGADEYLVKPVSREALRQAIQAVVNARADARRALAAVSPPKPAPTGARILLADDSEINLLAFRDYLEEKGYQVAVARTGREAVDQAVSLLPDLILMDIQMPGMDGLEAIGRIRANHDLPSVPIIALTALAMAGDRERCLAAGANAYMSKPVSLKGLLELIQRLLAP